MAIFDFGKKQRLHAQLVGHTSGNEMFKVDEYNQRKKTSIVLSTSIFGFLTLFYFFISSIPMKILIFLILITIGLGVWLFFNFKEQKRLRERLYQ